MKHATTSTWQYMDFGQQCADMYDQDADEIQEGVDGSVVCWVTVWTLMSLLARVSCGRGQGTDTAHFCNQIFQLADEITKQLVRLSFHNAGRYLWIVGHVSSQPYLPIVAQRAIKTIIFKAMKFGPIVIVSDMKSSSRWSDESGATEELDSERRRKMWKESMAEWCY